MNNFLNNQFLQHLILILNVIINNQHLHILYLIHQINQNLNIYFSMDMVFNLEKI